MSGGLAGSAKHFIAISTRCSITAYLHFVDTSVTANASDELSSQLIDEERGPTSLAYKSLTFDNYSGQLACTNDAGIIKLFDISSNKMLSSFSGDSSGLESVKFSSSGLLFSIGRSVRGQVQVWDTRRSPNRSEATKVGSLRVPGEYLNGNASRLSCVLPHTTQEHILFCGTSSGSILQYDLRSGLPLAEYKPHLGAGLCEISACELYNNSCFLSNCNAAMWVKIHFKWYF